MASRSGGRTLLKYCFKSCLTHTVFTYEMHALNMHTPSTQNTSLTRLSHGRGEDKRQDGADPRARPPLAPRTREVVRFAMPCALP